MAGKKLLVADDSLTIQKVIRLALSNEGYEIQAISDGADALQQISVFRPDLVLIDVSLPTRSAFEIKRELNTMDDFENTRFILMSSAFEKIDEAQATEVKFHGRLTKPFDPAHLRQVLQEVLKGQPQQNTASLSKRPTKPATPASIPLDPGPPPSAFPTDKSTSMIHLDPPSFEPSGLQEFETEEQSPPSSFPDFTSPGRNKPSEGISISFENPKSAFADSADSEDEDDDSHDNRGSQKDEIKHLTESTIRMSGLDDFDWTVNDSNLKPPSSMADDGGTGFRMRPQFSEEAAPPQGMPPLSQTRSTGSSSNTKSAPASFPSQASHSAPAGPSFSSEQLEEAVKRQVEETLTEMAQKILPELAERLIKAEIHRLLNEKF